MFIGMKKVLPILLFLSLIAAQVSAQIPPEGYTLQGSPIDFTNWLIPPTVTSGPSGTLDDEIILVNGANDIGYVKYYQPRKLFFCDSTVVEFEFKSEPNSNGGADGLAFWMLTVAPNTHVASPSLGIPMNSTGHAFFIDLYDNDNNANNPIIGSRTFNGGANNNYVENGGVGQLPANRDSALVPNLGAGIWHHVKLVYTFTPAGAVQLEARINDVIRWTGVAFTTTPTTNTTFGFSATNGTTNFSKLSIRDVSVIPHPLPPEVLIPTFCTDQRPLAFVYPQGGSAVWYEDLNTTFFSVTPPAIDSTQADTFEFYLGARVISNNQFCYGDRRKVTAIVHQSPTIDFDFTKIEGCGADTLTFLNRSRDADLYFWNFGDGTDTSVFETNHIFNGAGTYNVVLRGQNEFCTDSSNHVITLENPFVVDFNISADSICQNSFITFENLSQISDKNNIPTYWKWDFGTAPWDTLITKDPPMKYYYEPGTYNITLTVTNGLPCTDSITKTVFVDPYPSLDFKRVDTVICVGDNITVNGTVLTEGLNSLTWDFGDGSPIISDTTNITKAYSIPGVYTITANAEYRICPDSSFARQVKVNATPKFNLPKDTVMCYLGEGFTIGNIISVPGATYAWSTGDSTPTIRVTNPGTYSARMTLDGCSTNDDITITRDCYINIPNAFSPDGDGLNDHFFPRNQSEQSIKTFKMQIYNRYGQLIFETERPEGSGWDGRFNGVEQPFGVYVYTIDVEFVNGHKEAYHGNVTLIR